MKLLMKRRLIELSRLWRQGPGLKLAEGFVCMRTRGIAQEPTPHQCGHMTVLVISGGHLIDEAQSMQRT